MKCSQCGAELPLGAEACPACRAGMARPAISKETSWEVRGTSMEPRTMTTRQLIDALLARSLDMNTAVRHVGGKDWILAESVPEVSLACPWIPFARQGRWNDELGGLVTISGSRDRVLEFARNARGTPAFGQVDFHFPVLAQGHDLALVGAAQLFQMWDGFYVGCLLRSHRIKPGHPLDIFLIAANFLGQPQTRRLIPDEFVPPEQVRPLLEFSLPAYSWAVHHIQMVPAPDSSIRKLVFRSTSTGKKAAKAVAVSLATLGAIRYHPGERAFSTAYMVMPAPEAANLDKFQNMAEKVLRLIFDDSHSDAIVGPEGVRTPRDVVLSSFHNFLEESPDAIFEAFQEHQDVAKAMKELATGFMMLEFGSDANFAPATPVPA